MAHPRIQVPAESRTLNFGKRKMGASKSLPVTVTNVGAAPLEVKATNGPEGYHFEPPSTFTVLQGETEELTVRFEPDEVGNFDGDFILTTNDPSQPSVTITLAGQGVASAIEVDQEPIDFGEYVTGASVGKSAEITVTNVGDSTIVVTPSLIGDGAESYDVSPDTQSLLVGESKKFTVLFAPLVDELAEAELRLSDEEQGNPAAVVALTGRGISPVLEVVSELAFGEYPVGGSKELQLSVTNGGTGTMVVNVGTPTGGDASAFTVTTAQLSVGAGQSKTFAVRFTPSGGGARNATLPLTIEGLTVVTNVALKGTAISPTLQVASELVFGESPVGGSKEMQLSVTNGGTGTMVVNRGTLGGGGASNYTVTPPQLSVGAGLSGTFTVRFTPSGSGARNATLPLTIEGLTAVTNVALKGTAISPTLQVASELVFGESPVGGGGKEMQLSVTNRGTGTMVVNRGALGGGEASDYTVTPPQLSVGAGLSGTFTVRFTPSGSGSRNATLPLTIEGLTAVTNVALKGTAISPTLQVASELVFGEYPVQGSKEMQLSVTNGGTGTMVVNRGTLGGGGASDYTVTPPQLSVGAGLSGTFTVRFTPSGSGSRSATLPLTIEGLTAVTNVALKGTAISPTLQVVSELVFGEYPVGGSKELQLSVTNGGTGTMVVNVGTPTGGDASAFTVTTAQLSVGAGQSKTFAVRFTPSGGGARNATLPLTIEGLTAVTNVALKGTAISPTLQVVSELVFGESPVGGSKEMQLSVTNGGTGTMVVNRGTLGGGGASNYTVTPPQLSVGAGLSGTFTVRFTPSGSGARDATLPLTIEGLTAVTNVDLKGTAISLVLQVASELVFGEYPVGGSKELQLSVTNGGTGTMVVNRGTLGGGGASAYTVTPPQLSVGAGLSGTFTVRFTPSGSGARDATLPLTIEGLPTVTNVDLKGTAISPALQVASELVFGEYPVGGSKELQLSVTNGGTGTMVVNRGTLGGGGASAYTVTPPQLSVGAGLSGTFTVRFTPSGSGARNATLPLTIEGLTAVTNIALKGTAISPALQVASELVFGEYPVGGSKELQLSVTNGGTGTMVVNRGTLGGGEASDYTVTPPQLFVGAGLSGTFTVRFTPSGSGARDATLPLTIEGLPAVTNVALKGTAISPALQVASELVFGEYPVGGGGKELQLSVTNGGTGTMVVNRGTLGGGGASAYTVTPPQLSVGAGLSGTFTVRFTPNGNNAFNATLPLTIEGLAAVTNVALTGTGISPRIQVSGTLPFGEYPEGASKELPLSVTNTGTGTLVVEQGTLVGSGASAYTVTPAKLNVGTGLSGAFTVRFTPSSTGSANATLNLTTNDTTKPTQAVQLTGTGVHPVLSVDPVLDFDYVLIGSTTKKVLTVTNTGSGTLSVTAGTLTGVGFSFFLLNKTSLSVGAGKSESFEVTFNPTTAVEADVELPLTTNAPDSANHVVRLKGIAATPSISLCVDPKNDSCSNDVDFGSVRLGGSKKIVVRIKNNGHVPLGIISRSVGAPFSTSGLEPMVIEAGGSFDFQVVFTPLATDEGIRTGTLQIVSTAVSSPTGLSLRGIGVVPHLALSTSTLSFGDVKVGSPSVLPLTISSDSTAEVNVTGVTTQGPFTISHSAVAPCTLPGKVVSGSPCALLVEFRPSQEGATQVDDHVTFNTDVGPLKVSVSGIGTVARMKLSDTLIDFKTQRVEHPSSPRLLVVQNLGRAQLEITQILPADSAFALTDPLPPSEGNPITVIPGGQKVLSLKFTPTRLGDVEGKLFIVSNSVQDPQAPIVLPILKGSGIDGELTPTPRTVLFGPVDVGSSQQRSVSVVNTGAYQLQINTVGLPTNNAFTVSTLCAGRVLQPGQDCTFNVTFTPLVRGYVPASVQITSDSVRSPQLGLDLNGTGVAAAIELLPEELVFGESNVGGGPVPQDMSIKNVGENPLAVSNIAFADAETPGASQDFSLDGSVKLPLIVASGESTLVRINFKPRVVGLREARAIVFANAKGADGNNVEAKLHGEGTSPRLLLSAPSVNCGSVLVNNPSPAQSLSISNTGDGPLILSSMELSGSDKDAFVVTKPALPITLAPESNTEILISVRPNAERQFSAQLLISSNDLGVPSVTVPLSGAGIRQEITLSEASLEFGRQFLYSGSAPRAVTVTNSSSSPVTLSGLSVEGEGAAQFSFAQKLTLPYVLQPKSASRAAEQSSNKVDLGMIFTPVTEAEVNSKLKITFSDPPLQLEVSLHGQGIASVLSVKAAALDFGATRIGSTGLEQLLTIANLSSEGIVLAEPEVLYKSGEPFIYDAAGLKGRSIPPGASIIVPVGYQPQVETLSETTLAFGTLVPNKPRAAEVRLTGRATERLLGVDPGSLDFGWVDVNVPMEPKEVTIVNHSSQQQRVLVKLTAAGETSFTVDAKELEKPLPAGGSVTFKIAFTPRKAGEAQNELEVWLQGESRAEAVIALAGRGRTLMGEGGGCYSSGSSAGGAGLLALMTLMGLGWRRRRQG
ncbi:choice-of-anchor D domain-containing protein [Stigmatella aurantiaca]|uniref:choice-of-anchor D domain-containing protein n=1 Tax=Stigmatella aurantiaca TaxID=41 RepID=UPI0016517925|nr:choice-of-anchor D domain-containing protein [Stigmatella aurantiaca]